MSVLRHSSLAVRRVYGRCSRPANLTQRTRRPYATVSQPVFQMAQEGSMSGSGAVRESLGLPLALALLGLSFSTYSTHQMMLCSQFKAKDQK